MAKFYIFTAGTSLLDNLEKGNREEQNYGEKLSDILTSIMDTDCLLVSKPDDTWLGEIASTPGARPGARWALTYYGCKDPLEQSESTVPHTAEISSFAKLDLKEDDQVVLLSSDTPDGAFCALVNAHLMAKAKPGDPPVCIWEGPGEGAQSRNEIPVNWDDEKTLSVRNSTLTSLGRRKAHVVRVKELNPMFPSGFKERAVGNLVRTINDLVNIALGQDPVLHPEIVFTGGFKVSLPVLTQAASWMGGIPMLGLHLKSKEMIHIPVLPSRPEEELIHAVVGWAWLANREKKILEWQFKDNLMRFAKMTDKVFWALEPSRLRSLFKPAGEKVSLNLLGEALLAVQLAEIVRKQSRK